jgi:hypothetical protein
VLASISMRLLRRLIASCAGPVLQHARGPTDHALWCGARSDGVDVVVAVERRPSFVEAGRRIAAQLELALRDARVRTLRATTVPLTVGALLAFLSVYVGTQALAPQASHWLDALIIAIGALGWSGFLPSLDPTSEVMPLVGAYVSIFFNALRRARSCRWSARTSRSSSTR